MAAIGGLVIYEQVTVTPTVAQVEAAGTVLASIAIPADAIVLDVMVYATDMDTNGSPTLALDVGDSAGPETPDDNRLIAAFNQDSGADTIHSSWSGNLTENPVDYSGLTVTGATVDIECTVETVAATGAAGTLTMGITYVRR
jgi:hypothetical protein